MTIFPRSFIRLLPCLLLASWLWPLHAFAEEPVEEYAMLAGQAKALLNQNPQEAIRQGEQALNLMPGNVEPSQKMGVLATLAVAYARIGQVERATTLVEQALAIGEQEGGDVLAQALVTQGAVAVSMGNPAGAREGIARALAILGQQGDSELRANALAIDGNIRLHGGDAAGAVERFFEVLAIAEERDDRLQLVHAENNIGAALMSMGDLDAAQDHLQRAYGLLSKQGDRLLRLNLGANLGVVLMELGKVEDAITRYDEALALARELRLNPRISALLINLADAYLNVGDYPRAISLSEESLALSLEQQDLQQVAISQVNLGQAYLATGKTWQGIENFKMALNMFESVDDSLHAGELLRILSDAYEKAGDMEQALVFHKRYKEASDASVNAQSRSTIADLEEKYQAAEREKAIQQLTQQQLVQEAEIRQQQLIFIGTIVGVVLLLVLLGFVIHGMLLSRRANREISAANARLEEANRRLEEQAVTDQLTSLFNRWYFFNIAPEEAALILRKTKDGGNGNHHISFLMVDADHFKVINDQWGHSVGDLVLKNFARRLRELVRESDTLIRWGGEEFLIMSRECDHPGAILLAERICRSIAATPLDEERSIFLTCSIGFASFPFSSREPERVDWSDALKLADASLLRAKESGRNSYVGIRPGGRDWMSRTPDQLVQNLDLARDLGLVVLDTPDARAPGV